MIRFIQCILREMEGIIVEAGVTGIPDSADWTRIEPVLKGWSNDKKYYIEDGEGRKLLLRLSGREELGRKQAEYEMIKLINQLNFPMSRAMEYGLCNDGLNTYMLLSWVEGCPLEDCLTTFPVSRQYELGVQAGRLLKQIHSVPNTGDLSHWEDYMRARILSRVEQYENCPYQVKGDTAAIAFIRENIGLLDKVEKVYRHGDFHIGNLIYTDQEEIGVIDFNRCGSGDYVEDFYKLQAFDREKSVSFAKGRIEGYFEGAPPDEFWMRHALYVAYSSLYSIAWGIPFGNAEIEGMIIRCEVALEDYNHFTSIIPRWYI